MEAAERGDDNTTSAGDMAPLMAELGRAEQIPVRACRRVLHGLGESHHTDVIARHLWAPGRVVACKQGMLDRVLHDVALIEDGAREWRWRCCRRHRPRPRGSPGAAPREIHAAVTGCSR